MASRSNFYLLDTNVIIAAMKGQAEVRARLERTPLAEIILSPIVLGELAFGAEKSANPQRNFERLVQLTSRLGLAPIDGRTTRHYARIRALLERQGRGIGANDTWIAAHALGLGASVVTDNVGEFSRVPDLPVENWLRARG